MRLLQLAAVVVGLLAIPAAALAHGWQIDGGSVSSPLVLSRDLDGTAVSYQFECRRDHVVVRETGVTQLMDVKTGVKVGDEPGSAMTPGAAYMAIMLDSGQPDLVPAQASANAKKGWDLSIDLPLKAPSLQGLRKAKAMTLMTTGWTILVELDADDRKVIGAFLDRCAAT